MLSKRGVCSRTEAARWIAAGRVTVGGAVVRDPEYPTADGRRSIAVDGRRCAAPERVLHRAEQTARPGDHDTDERGRDTVYRCLDGAGCRGWRRSVAWTRRAKACCCSATIRMGRRVTDPATGPDKVYHVQVDAIPDELLAALVGASTTTATFLRASSARGAARGRNERLAGNGAG